MIHLENVQIEGYPIQLEIGPDSKVGVFARSLELQKSLLLVLAGINPTPKESRYLEENLYDNPHYFRERIFLDTNKKYIGHLRIKELVTHFKQTFDLEVDGELLKKHILQLNVKGECEIGTRTQFTKAGLSLATVCLALSTHKNLLLHQPTRHITNPADLAYIKEQLLALPNFVVLGIDHPTLWEKGLDAYFIFTDYQKTVLLDPVLDQLWLVDDVIIFKDSKLFFCQGCKKIIVKNLTKEQKVHCDRYKIPYEKISFSAMMRWINE
ncbi:MAG: hypothetical protein PHP41_03030 [Bacilli bacterium]|nr:hypothetical protein [Bacilli bacterium]